MSQRLVFDAERCERAARRFQTEADRNTRLGRLDLVAMDEDSVRHYQRLATMCRQAAGQAVVVPFIPRAERPEDMSPTGRLTLYRQEDGDVIVQITTGERDDFVMASVEFCTPAGGGQSEQTWQALCRLMDAMADDTTTSAARDPLAEADRASRLAAKVQSSPALADQLPEG